MKEGAPLRLSTEFIDVKALDDEAFDAWLCEVSELKKHIFNSSLSPSYYRDRSSSLALRAARYKDHDEVVGFFIAVARQIDLALPPSSSSRNQSEHSSIETIAITKKERRAEEETSHRHMVCAWTSITGVLPGYEGRFHACVSQWRCLRLFHTANLFKSGNPKLEHFLLVSNSNPISTYLLAKHFSVLCPDPRNKNLHQKQWRTTGYEEIHDHEDKKTKSCFSLSKIREKLVLNLFPDRYQNFLDSHGGIVNGASQREKVVIHGVDQNPLLRACIELHGGEEWQRQGNRLFLLVRVNARDLLSSFCIYYILAPLLKFFSLFLGSLRQRAENCTRK